MDELGGKVAVVTGAARGIGLGVAAALADAGMKVVLSDLASPTLEAAARGLAERGAEVAALPCDVRDAGAVQGLAAQSVERFGSVHLVCNNAGVMVSGRAWELSLEDWHRVLDVNLWGVIHGVRAFVPHLIEAPGGGHVVNVASRAAVTPVAAIAPYNVSKHGVLALSETLKLDLQAAGADVGVTVVMPGRVATSLGLRPPGEPPAEQAADEERHVLSPDTVGKQVVAAVRRDQLYLFTHEHLRSSVERRFQRILAD